MQIHKQKSFFLLEQPKILLEQQLDFAFLKKSISTIVPFSSFVIVIVVGAQVFDGKVALGIV